MQRKRQIPDAEGFIQPSKFTKVNELKSLTKSTNFYIKQFRILMGETAKAGPSGDVAQVAIPQTTKERTPKEKRMPPVVAKPWPWLTA